MKMTHRWLKDVVNILIAHQTSMDIIKHSSQLQGSTYKDLRKESAEAIASFEREGNDWWTISRRACR